MQNLMFSVTRKDGELQVCVYVCKGRHACMDRSRLVFSRVGLEVPSLSHPSLLFTSLRQILQHLLQAVEAWEETAGPPDGLCRSNLAARIEALLD